MINNLVPANEKSVLSIPQSVRGYVSPLEKIATYAELWQAGEMFAGSQLVPESFRGKPGDCAIALDLALRLDLNPLSLFPQLYVIHGRPSLSAQYMIALVNRSGRFTPITWQEGDDGVVEYTAYGKTRKIPNYYAIASFKSALTGETYASTRVDVRLAHANGWLTKDGSKWQTMPAQMCRYRSASWLIKSYAPELAMGLSFADESEDIEAPEIADNSVAVAALKNDPLALVIDDAAPVATTPSRFNELKTALETAADLDALKAIGVEVSTATLAPHELDELRRLYLDRKKELAQKPTLHPSSIIDTGNNKIQVLDVEKLAAQSAEKASIAQEETAPKPTRKRASKNKMSLEAQRPLDASVIEDNAAAETPTPGAEKLIELEIGTALENAANVDDLDRAVGRIVDNANAGDLDKVAKERLIKNARDRFGVISQHFITDDATDEMTVYCRQIREALESAAETDNKSAFDNALRCIDFWFVHGRITTEQRVELFEVAAKLYQ